MSQVLPERIEGIDCQTMFPARFHIDGFEDITEADLPLPDAIMHLSVDLRTHQDDPEQHMVDLSIQLRREDGIKIPYEIDLVMRGFFKISSTVTDNLRNGFLLNGAPSMLFSAAREFVYSITARCPQGGFLLSVTRFAVPKSNAAESATASAKKRIAKPRRAKPA